VGSTERWKSIEETIRRNDRSLTARREKAAAWGSTGMLTARDDREISGALANQRLRAARAR
jgi:hypothetical protein